MLALLAGRGALPDAIAAAQDGDVVICALESDPPNRLEVDLWFRVETLGSLLDQLKARGVDRICTAGAIGRPQIDPAAIDAATLPLVLGAGAFDALQLPFVVGSYQDLSDVLTSELGNELLATLDQYSIKGVGFVEAGQRHFLTSGDAVTSTGGFAGLKTRIVPIPLHKAIWEAIGVNPIASVYTGIDVGRTKFLAFVISGAVAGFCGYLWISRYVIASTEVAGGYELTIIAACVIGGVSIAGGIGSVPGVLLGALFLGVINNALPVINISPFWQMAISGAAILLAVVLNARGEASKGRIILKKAEAG